MLRIEGCNHQFFVFDKICPRMIEISPHPLPLPSAGLPCTMLRSGPAGRQGRGKAWEVGRRAFKISNFYLANH